MLSLAGWSWWIWQHRAPVSPEAGPQHLPVLTPQGGGCGAGGWDPRFMAQSQTGPSPTRERVEEHRRETCRDALSEAAARLTALCSGVLGAGCGRIPARGGARAAAGPSTGAGGTRGDAAEGGWCRVRGQRWHPVGSAQPCAPCSKGRRGEARG